MTAPGVTSSASVRGAATVLRRWRAAVVAGAVLAALLVWLVIDPVLGRELRVVEEEQVMEIGLFPVVSLSLAFALAGWALLAALERFVRRALGVWIVVATAALLLSFLPLAGDGMSGGTRVGLALTHLAVAAVLIPGLTRSAPGWLARR